MKPIKFGTNHDDLMKLISKNFPIKIKSIDSVITRIHEQYPVVDRSVVSSVVQAFFATMRDEMLSGKLLNFAKYLPAMGIFIYSRNESTVIKTKIKTPESLK